MIPGMLGKNIEQWIREDNLPRTISRFGTTVEEIFVSYEDPRSIELRSQRAKAAGLLGVFMWELTGDDERFRRFASSEHADSALEQQACQSALPA